jgi:hypothetical protein
MSLVCNLSIWRLKQGYNSETLSLTNTQKLKRQKEKHQIRKSSRLLTSLPILEKFDGVLNETTEYMGPFSMKSNVNL